MNDNANNAFAVIFREADGELPEEQPLADDQDSRARRSKRKSAGVKEPDHARHEKESEIKTSARSCKYCGTEIHKREGVRVSTYCSPACQVYGRRAAQAASRARRKEEELAAQGPVLCAWCTTPIPPEKKKLNEVYCQEECAYRAHAEKHK